MEEPQGACWGGSGCNVSTVYPLLPGRWTRGGLSLSIKTSPSLQRRRGCSRRGRVYLGLVLQVCTVTSHVTRCHAVQQCTTQFTQTELQCLKCDLALGTSPLPLDTGARIVNCFRRRPLLPLLWSVESLDLVQGNILVVCMCSTWLVPTPSSQLGTAQCFLLCSFIGVLLSSPPLIPGLDVSQLFPTMHSSISAANRQAAANINKLRIKVRILSLSSNIRA